MSYQQIIKQLRAMREESGISQSKIGKSIGVGRTQVTNIETGARGTPIDRLEAYAQALGCRLLLQLVPADGSVADIKAEVDVVRLANEIQAAPKLDRELIRSFLRALPTLSERERKTWQYEIGLILDDEDQALQREA